MAGRHSREQWQELIAEQEQSGVTIAEFCRLQDVGPASFYQWRKRLRGEQEAGRAEEPVREPPFVPVSITGTSEVEIALPCGATLHVAHDGPALQQVLKALLEMGRTA